MLESVGIPSIQFSRAPFLEYHTAEDTPDIISRGELKDTVKAVYELIRDIERDFIPIPTYKGVPCLSRYGLWNSDLRIEKIYQLLGYNLSISYIAKMTNIPFNYVYTFIKKMEEKGLVKR